MCPKCGNKVTFYTGTGYGYYKIKKSKHLVRVIPHRQICPNCKYKFDAKTY